MEATRGRFLIAGCDSGSQLIAARAFREHGANHATAILSYLAYTRQDKPARFKREPTTAKLMIEAEEK